MATIDKERYNLLYRPDLRPERGYRSEAVFEEPDIPVGAIVPEETVEDVLQDLKDLEEVSLGLPEGLDFVNEIVTKLRQRAEILEVEEKLTELINPPTTSTPMTFDTPTGYTPPTPNVSPPDTPVFLPLPVTVPTAEDSVPGSPVNTPTTTIIQTGTTETPSGTPSTYTSEPIPEGTYVYEKDYIPPAGTIVIPEEQPFVFIGSNVVEDPYGIPNLPTSFAPSTDITLSIKTPKSLVEIAQESYKKDQIDLQKFYLQKMRMALQRYFHHLLSLTAELGLSNPDMLTKKYDGDSVTGVGANFKHLHDTIVRSQIQRAQKVRLSKKMANADLTMTHMRAWHAAEKERERYYTEAYGNAETFVNSESNALLRQARSDYDAAYKLSLYNMYKYLDASVKLTEDILDHTLIEAKAKAKLTKEGVDIFKTKEVTVTKDNNAVQTLKPSTKEERDAEKQAKEQEKAKENQGQKTQETKEEKAKRIDEAKGITDPDENFELAPSGGHYSKNDIDYLCNSDPEFYNRDTATGRANIMAALNTSEKYISTESEDNADKSGNTEDNSDSYNSEQATTEKSNPKTEEQKPVNQADTEKSSEDDKKSEVQKESDNKVAEATKEETPVTSDAKETTGESDSSNDTSTSKYKDISFILQAGAFSVNGYFKAQRKSSKDKWQEKAKVTVSNRLSSRILGDLCFENGSWSTYKTNVGNDSTKVISIWEEHFGENWTKEGYGLIHTIDVGDGKPYILSSSDISAIIAQVTVDSSYYG